MWWRRPLCVARARRRRARDDRTGVARRRVWRGGSPTSSSGTGDAAARRLHGARRHPGLGPGVAADGRRPHGRGRHRRLPRAGARRARAAEAVTVAVIVAGLAPARRLRPPAATRRGPPGADGDGVRRRRRARGRDGVDLVNASPRPRSGAAVGAAVTLLLPVSRVADRRRALVERARRLRDVYALVGTELAPSGQPIRRRSGAARGRGGRRAGRGRRPISTSPSSRRHGAIGAGATAPRSTSSSHGRGGWRRPPRR